jgi:phosphomannomutase
MATSGVQFGTSGVRGLVKDMTDKVCFSYVSAFLQYLISRELIKQGDEVCIAGDLRNSTPRIINAAIIACRHKGLEPVFMGMIPAPAIALYGITHHLATIMVTGSHIPDDRNGIKFNLPTGEILKADENGIREQIIEIDSSLFDIQDAFVHKVSLPVPSDAAAINYHHRFIDFFPPQCLAGKHIGVYEHSSVSRNLMCSIFESLGAKVTLLGRSQEFISVDTEAIRPEDVALAKDWASEHDFDCLVSTDGDGDRPLISDEHGEWLRGDIAGILCAQYLDASTVITPVSSNSIVEKCGYFEKVIRTRIGSPYVIEAMQSVASQKVSNSIVGYEANGGFLQETLIVKVDKNLPPLPTRDALIVALSVIMLTIEKSCTVSELLASLPSRYTYSGRLKNYPTKMSQQTLSVLTSDDVKENLIAFQALFPELSSPESFDYTDGVRVTLRDQSVIHLRPSGNAPELRCYTESDTELEAKKLNAYCLEQMKMHLNSAQA